MIYLSPLLLRPSFRIGKRAPRLWSCFESINFVTSVNASGIPAYPRDHSPKKELIDLLRARFLPGIRLPDDNGKGEGSTRGRMAEKNSEKFLGNFFWKNYSNK